MLDNLQVGTDADAPASDAALTLVFSGEPELGANPPTLLVLAKKIDSLADDVHEFTPPNLGFQGQFRVRVSNNVIHELASSATADSDGDGVPDHGGFAMAQSEAIEQITGVGCVSSPRIDSTNSGTNYRRWTKTETSSTTSSCRGRGSASRRSSSSRSTPERTVRDTVSATPTARIGCCR